MKVEPSPPTRAREGHLGHIEVRVSDLQRLFNSMDPSPFMERDLDPRAEEFIISWAREAPRGVPLALTVHVDQRTEVAPEGMFSAAIHSFFQYRADVTRRRLRELFRVGRTSLFIGLLALTIAFGLVQLLGKIGGQFVELLREGVLIGGWVAMWRPLEIFLYEWWPIRRDVRLYDRLGEMPVSIATGRVDG
jgi:hypothetical protein